MIPKTQCRMCGDLFEDIVRHRCNLNRANYAQNRLKKPTDPFIHLVARSDTFFPHNKVNLETDCVYFDFETIIIDEHKVYAVGAYHGSSGYTSFFGIDAMKNFLNWLMSIQPRTNAKGHFLPITCMAWNGCRYDFKLILSFLIKTPEFRDGTLCIDNIVVNSGRLLVLKMGIGRFQFWDPCQFVPSPLAKACEDFGVSKDATKSVFPHRLIHDYEVMSQFVSLDQLNDPNNYMGDDGGKVIKKPWTIRQLNEMNVKTSVVDGSFLLGDICKFYLEKDVMGMREIVEKLFFIFSNDFKVNPFMYCTISSMGKSLWVESNQWKHLIVRPRNEEQYTIMKGAVYGGRVDVHRNYYKAEGFDFEKILEGHDLEQIGNKFTFLNHGLKFTDWEHNSMREVDYTSLYVSVMHEFSFPIGEAKTLSAGQIELLNVQDIESLDERDKSLFYALRGKQGIFRVSYKPNRMLAFPILARRGSTSTNGTLSWDLREGEGFYTTVDLAMAEKCHYDIIVLGGIYWDESRPIFKDFMEMTYRLKEEGEKEGNDAKRCCGKVCGNSVYGGCLQKDYDEVYKLAYSVSEYVDFVTEFNITGANFFGNDVVGLMGSKQVTIHKAPIHLGAFILSFARELMFREFVKLDPNMLIHPSQLNRADVKESLENGWFYTDTDSAWIKSSVVHKLDRLGENLGMMKDESCKFRPVDPSFTEEAMREEPHRFYQLDGHWVERVGSVVLMRLNPAKKEYCNICINPRNELTVSIKSKGISVSLMKLQYFLKALTNEGDRSTVVTMPDKIKSFNFKSAETFFQVKRVELTRTFAKSKYTDRVLVNENLDLDNEGHYSLPHGHSLVDEDEVEFEAVVADSLEVNDESWTVIEEEATLTDDWIDLTREKRRRVIEEDEEEEVPLTLNRVKSKRRVLTDESSESDVSESENDSFIDDDEEVIDDSQSEDEALLTESESASDQSDSEPEDDGHLYGVGQPKARRSRFIDYEADF